MKEQYHILYVERNAHNVQDLRDYLEDSPYPYEIEQVKSISKCISRIKKANIAAVILNYDISVNLLDDILRDLLKAQNIPLIVISRKKKSFRQNILEALDPEVIVSHKKAKPPVIASHLVASIQKSTPGEAENEQESPANDSIHASSSYFIFSPPDNIEFYTAEAFPVIQSLGKVKFSKLLKTLYTNYTAGVRKLEVQEGRSIYVLEMGRIQWNKMNAISVEISEIKEIASDELFRESFKDLFESDITAMIIHDSELVIEANQKALEFFKLKNSEIIGLALHKLFKTKLNYNSILFAHTEDLLLLQQKNSVKRTVTSRPIRFSGKRCWISVFTPDTKEHTSNDAHIEQILDPLEELSELVNEDFKKEKEFLNDILARLCSELGMECGYIGEQTNGSLKLISKYGKDPNISSMNSFPLYGTIESDIIKYNEMFFYDGDEPKGLEGKNYRFPAHKAQVYIGLPIEIGDEKNAIIAIYSNGSVNFNLDSSDKITLLRYSTLISSYFGIKNKLIQKSVDSILSEVVNESADKKDIDHLMKMASHDLQEPLRIIYNYSEILKRKLKGFPDKGKSEEFLSYLTFIKESADKIDQLIKGFKSYVAIQDSTESFSIVNLTDLFEDVMIDMNEKIDSSNASISIGKMPEVSANRDSLRILLFQLIDNAISFKAKDKNPVIQIDAKEEKDHWIVSVKDNGVGIEKQYLNKIFHVLEKVEQGSPASSGLGLSMCKSIVEQHGGKIWVDSMPGYGSTFSFSIPKI